MRDPLTGPIPVQPSKRGFQGPDVGWQVNITEPASGPAYAFCFREAEARVFFRVALARALAKRRCGFAASLAPPSSPDLSRKPHASKKVDTRSPPGCGLARRAPRLASREDRRASP